MQLWHDARLVCRECFADPTLRERVQREGDLGECTWCDATEVSVIPLIRLADDFRHIARIYREVTGPDAVMRAEPIGWLLQADWRLFSERIVERELVNDLSEAILTAGLTPDQMLDEPDFAGGLFRRPEARLTRNWVEAVDRLLEEEKGERGSGRRWNVSGHYVPSRLEVAIDDIATRLTEGTFLFRARIYEERGRDERYSAEELGAPSAEDVNERGRANRRNEPVLYCATDPETAVAEVRAWEGAAVAVARLRVVEDIWIVDVRDPEPVESPFHVDNLGWRLELNSVLRQFGRELSRPVLPGEENVLYRASRALCDYVEASGHDGVSYPSALGSGHNIVLFNLAGAEVVERRDVRVSDVAYEVRQLDPADPLYRRTPYDHRLNTNQG